MKLDKRKILSLLLSTIIISVGANVALANTEYWSGQGTSNGKLENSQCDSEDPRGQGVPYLLWVFTFDGYTISDPLLNLGGSGSGSFPMVTSGGESHNVKVVTDYSDLSSLTASVDFNVDTQGTGTIGLKISSGCAPEGPPVPELNPTILTVTGLFGLVLLSRRYKKN